MTTYEVIAFRGTTFELPAEDEVVAVEYNSHSGAVSYATIERGTPDTEGVGGPFYCEAELTSGAECGREVSSPDERCWQHSDDSK